MYRILALLLCISVLGKLPAAPNTSIGNQSPCVVAELAPCAFVHDMVNAVDGTLYLKMPHLSVPGHVPLDFIQYYTNKNDYSSWFGSGMTCNYSFAAWVQHFSDKKHDTKDKYSQILAESPGGSIIRCLGKIKSNKRTAFYLDPAVIHDGFTNSSSMLSGRTNLKNTRIEHFLKDNIFGDINCYLPDGTERKYYSIYDLPTTYVYAEKRPNTTKLAFDYHWHEERASGQKIRRIDSIKKITAKADDHTVNWLEFSKKEHSAQIHSSNGKFVHFSGFERDGNVYIDKITSSDNPKIEFDYHKAGKYYCISRIKWPEKRLLEIDYDHKARVKTLKAAVGGHGELHTLYTFHYHDHHTDVIDANNHKKTYSHKKGRVHAIDGYSDDKTRYRSHAFYWGEKEGHSWGKQPKSDEGNLLAYATLNSQHCAEKLCYYDYDDFGNITKETLCGNLSGSYPWAFWVDDTGRPKDPNVEKHHKYYTYSKEHLLTRQTEDDGPTVEYRYKKGTDLMWAKFVKDGDKIVIREFYAYNAAGILIEKIVDDGVTDNKSCLDGVTQRLITDIIPAHTHGLPQDVWENYFDLASGRKILLKHTHYNYNEAHQVSEEAIFDANNSYSHSIWYDYDHKGRLHRKTTPHGSWITNYDENDNKTYEKEESADYHTALTYDRANRCTSICEYHYDNSQVITGFTYDFMGNKTSSTDRYGNTTHYQYDHCNRLSKITLPKLEDGKEYTISKEYDIHDNLIRETNQNGHVTTYEYTIRHEPCLITYPDGTKERFYYKKNGQLADKWDRGGIRTSYTYDFLGRVTETSIYDSSDKLLSTTTNHYNAFHLVSTTDAMGYTTHFRYDGAGRKIEEWQESSDNYSKTTFEYDTLSRLYCTKRYFGHEISAFIATFYEYDKQDRIVLEKQQDAYGKETSWTYYEYDNCNRCILKRTGHTAGDDADRRYSYNSKNELIEECDEYGNRTQYKFFCQTGKIKPQKITTDALGNITEEYYDALARLVSTVRRNSQNQLLAATDFTYNGTGQKIEQVEHVVINGQIDHDYTITWEYDALDRVTKVVEQHDLKTTSYSYDAAGHILTITKPDGIILTHSYDALGRLIHLSSSDGTVSYTYTYDLNNSPIEVQDEVSQTTSLYTYDRWNRTLSDSIKGIYAQHYSYDALGRLLTITAPDGSIINYTYDNSNLQDITWKGFTHRYDSFDLKGRPTASTLLGNAGALYQTWDKKGRIVHIAHPHFTQEIAGDGFDAVGNLLKHSFKDPVGHIACTAKYDDLYQLVAETGVQSHTYSNDSISNRLSKNSASYTLDGTNKLLSTQDDAFTYDKNGNLITTKTHTLTYDALDRLITVSDGKQSVHYTYDNFHRRISQSSNNKTFYYVYFGQREVGRYNPASKMLDEYRVLGLGKGAELGASVAIQLGDSIYSPLHDHRGNIICLLDAHMGLPQETYRYTAFGEAETHSKNKPLNNPWGFMSKRVDHETGFSYFLNRYYSPMLGRWITPDPLGFADGPNIYAYVHNTPLTKFDLFGLHEEEDDLIGRCSIYCLAGMVYQTAIITRDTVSFAIHFAADPLGQTQKIATGFSNIVQKGITAFSNFEVDQIRDFMTHCPDTLATPSELSHEERSFEHGQITAEIGVTVGGLLGATKLGRASKLAETSAASNAALSQTRIGSVATTVSALGKAPFQLNRFHQAAQKLSPLGQQNIRSLRGWAKSKGWKKHPNNGGPEKWGTYDKEGKFTWNMLLKPEPSLRNGLEAGSGRPRFDARLDKGGNSYINPFKRERGGSDVGTHIPLE